MTDRISHVSLVVPDQTRARDWYVDKLDFEVRMDQPFPDQPEIQWITVGLPGQDLQVTLEPLGWGLAGDDPEEKEAMIGRQGFVIQVDACRDRVEELRDRGVHVVEGPIEMPWGISAVIEDLYGNTHNLLEPAAMEVPEV